MSRVRVAFIAALILLSPGLGTARADAPAAARSPAELAEAVERRAAATDFSDLEAFGEAAMALQGLEPPGEVAGVTPRD